LVFSVHRRVERKPRIAAVRQLESLTRSRNRASSLGSAFQAFQYVHPIMSYGRDIAGTGTAGAGSGVGSRNVTREPDLLQVGTTNEERLMARYAAGDMDAFQRLFSLLGPRVRGFFLRSFSDPTVADDLMQTTFLKLHRARASYQPQLPLKPWVFTIAAGVRRDELRRRYRLPPHVGEAELENAEAEVAGDGAGAPLAPGFDAGTSRADEVRAAVARLPESQRIVLHLHSYEELTFEQIALALGTSPGAVRVRASRGYERLRVALGARLAAEADAGQEGT
jgi:RNA polymerase sigma factor (sigma-70 family)